MRVRVRVRVRVCACVVVVVGCACCISGELAKEVALAAALEAVAAADC